MQYCSDLCILLLAKGKTHYRNFIGSALLLQNMLCLHMSTMQILQDNRPGWEMSKPNSFLFKLDKITATFEKRRHENDDWHANFCGATQVC